MKKLKCLFLGLLVFPVIVLANGFTEASSASESKYAVPSHHKKICRKNDALITAMLVPGSLKSNIERIAKNNGWPEVVWNVKNDYNWVSSTKIERRSLAALMESILDNYPLRAIFYQGNRVLVIEARTMR